MATADKRRPSIKMDVIAKELRRIYKDGGNRIEAKVVVDEAADPDSPLHPCFIWDDSKAAHEHRLFQARQLIATVRITIPATSTTTREVRAYHALRTDQSGYRHLKDIVTAPDLLEALVAQFASDLERVTERYEAIRKTSSARRVFQVIEEFCGKAKQLEAAE